jgi:molybdate transport system substrate-binding protein
MLIVLSTVVLLFAPARAGSPQGSAPLVVLCSNGIRAALEQLLPAAEQATGRRISVRYSSSTALKQSIDQGEIFDLAILTPEIVDELVKTARMRTGTRTDVASIELAVGVRAGAPKSDVGTPDAMKRRLLAARSLTWTEGGASSAATVAMVRALGIEDQVRSRIVLQHVPGSAAETVARGENELVFAPRSEIQTVAGVEVLGLFPKEFQRPVVMTAGIAAGARDAHAAEALIRFLTSSRAVPALQAAGMKPAAR